MSAIPIDLWLSPSAQALSILPLGLMGLLGVNLGVLVSLRMRRPSNNEGSHSPRAAEPTDHWPSIVVQVPIFNEGLLVRPCLEAVAGLDYPAEKLSIQLLDDSNDGSEAQNRLLAEQIAAHSGRPVEVIRRSDRVGFKAGALAVGLAHCDAEFAAVFDVDFLPPLDFLKSALQPLLHDPSVGFVQARWAHRG